MCLIVDKEFNTRQQARDFKKVPLTATRSMTVYKRLIPVGDEFCPPFQQSFMYRKKEKYSAKLGTSVYQSNITGGWKIAVNSGFHAYRLAADADSYRTFGEIIVPMIIPKGSEYFLGTRGEIVSNQIKIK